MSGFRNDIGGDQVQCDCADLPVDLPYRIGDKWTAHVLRGLQDGRRRFSVLRAEMSVTPKVLAETLRAMERDVTVSREAFDENPPRVEYELTAQGRKVLGLLDLCCAWARENLVET